MIRQLMMTAFCFGFLCGVTTVTALMAVMLYISRPTPLVVPYNVQQQARP
ncbi:hypothetical protein ACQR1Y_12495 [Bradyrhizobium sp. HKCCYLRH3099]